MTSDTRDFSSEPPSIGEIRAERTKHAEDWKPRDVLIHVLRMLDAGEITPDVLFVGWRQPETHACGHVAHTAELRCSAPDSDTLLGLLSRVHHQVLEDDT